MQTMLETITVRPIRYANLPDFIQEYAENNGIEYDLWYCAIGEHLLSYAPFCERANLEKQIHKFQFELETERPYTIVWNNEEIIPCPTS